MPNPPFYVGQRVVVTGNQTLKRFSEEPGTLRLMDSDDMWLVQFDHRTDLHDGAGAAFKSDRDDCWYVKSGMITPLPTDLNDYVLKSKVLEEAQRGLAEGNWCRDGMIESLARLGISAPDEVEISYTLRVTGYPAEMPYSSSASATIMRARDHVLVPEIPGATVELITVSEVRKKAR